MRVESTKGKNEWKCWLTPTEAGSLRDVAKVELSQKHYVVVLLGSKVGLRAEEMTRIRPMDVREVETDETARRTYRLRVPGKDTTGEHGSRGKERDAWLPEEVERELLEVQYQRDIEDDEPHLGVTTSRVRQIVKEAAVKNAERSVDFDVEEWRKVSSHDLRRYWAQTCLVRENLNPRVVMSVGGWDSFESLKPYLNAPTPEVVDGEFANVTF